MAKFRYYVTDVIDGNVKGTNDTATAEQLAGSEDYFVVDSEEGAWLQEGGVTEDIEEIKANTDD